MKAILVLDMPNRCFNCPLHQTVDGEEENEFVVVCNAEHWREPITHQPITNVNERPDFCPLKPLPEKKETFKNFGWVNGDRCEVHDPYLQGYNSCIDEIIGETE